MCPIYELRISDVDGKMFYTRRYPYCKRRHPDIDLSAAYKTDNIQPIAATSEIGRIERGWSCPLCNAGLPTLEMYTKQIAIRKHREEAHSVVTAGGGGGGSCRLA